MNKVDLLPYLDYDVSRVIEYVHQVNPKIRYMKLSAKTGEGMNEWYAWLQKLLLLFV